MCGTSDGDSHSIDSGAVQAGAARSTEMPNAEPGAPSQSPTATLICNGTNVFNAGHGHCDVYAPGNGNIGFCDHDFDAVLHLYANQSCPGCGQCVLSPTLSPTAATDAPYMPGSPSSPPSATPWCSGTAAFDAGNGGCDTYVPTGANSGHCSDFDTVLHLRANQSCPGCGWCVVPPTRGPTVPQTLAPRVPGSPSQSPSATLWCSGTSTFDAGHGGCATYTPSGVGASPLVRRVGGEEHESPPSNEVVCEGNIDSGLA
eukprot:gene23508-biopygen12754